MSPPVLDDMLLIDKNIAFQILTRVANTGTEVHIKTKDSSQINKTLISRIPGRRIFYVTNPVLMFEQEEDITFKIIIDGKLFFLKTTLKRATSQFYFETYSNFFELVRRKKPRFLVPETWSQSANVQGVSPHPNLKAPADIIDLSRAGMRLRVRPLLPRFEIDQMVNLSFKIYRRAEITVLSKIINLKRNSEGGPTIGVQYAENTILIGNKIQNVCDDLAFFYTSEAPL